MSRKIFYFTCDVELGWTVADRILESSARCAKTTLFLYNLVLIKMQ
ncbi:hypothetical protein HMPREF0645_2469 [Hallella bergensis DSM 17361]|uniref:Uncharacterized protein n=1 Tax=Hallella bergensis DSM 17361 TaxID=585502 RepID=D1PZT4_9BACT|nr:hypothetical protein HMPREF0645_2469 [Hallella bergensis DSM 17361]